TWGCTRGIPGTTRRTSPGCASAWAGDGACTKPGRSLAAFHRNGCIHSLRCPCSAQSSGAELLGPGIAQGVSTSYYPAMIRRPERFPRITDVLGRDALTSVFREFWPETATHVVHGRP